MDKTREVLKMFEGTHNFASLAMTKSSRTKKWRDPDTHLYIDIDRESDYFIRTIDKIEVEKVPPPLSPNLFSCYDAFDFYTAKFTAQSYFQNQVRYSSQQLIKLYTQINSELLLLKNSCDVYDDYKCR